MIFTEYNNNNMSATGENPHLKDLKHKLETLPKHFSHEQQIEMVDALFADPLFQNRKDKNYFSQPEDFQTIYDNHQTLALAYPRLFSMIIRHNNDKSDSMAVTLSVTATDSATATDTVTATEQGGATTDAAFRDVVRGLLQEAAEYRAALRTGESCSADAPATERR